MARVNRYADRPREKQAFLKCQLLNVRQEIKRGRVFRVKFRGMRADGMPIEEADVRQPDLFRQAFDVFHLGQRVIGRSLAAHRNAPGYLIRSLRSVTIELEQESYMFRNAVPVAVAPWLNAMNRVLATEAKMKPVSWEDLKASWVDAGRDFQRRATPGGRFNRFSHHQMHVRLAIGGIGFARFLTNNETENAGFPAAPLFFLDGLDLPGSVRKNGTPVRFTLQVHLAPQNGEEVFDVRNLMYMFAARALSAALHPLTGQEIRHDLTPMRRKP